MNRQIPLWVFLLCLLLGGVFVVVFGWSVRTTVTGSSSSGAFGRVAVQVSEFPSTTKQVVLELTGYVSGDYADAEVSIPREKAPDGPGFAPVSVAVGAAIPGLTLRATPETVPGWRLVSGTFEIDGEVMHAAMLISSDHEVVHLWRLDEEVSAGSAIEIRPRHRTFPHGIELLPDGSVIVAFDGGMTLQRIDACGGRDWVLDGEFHHALTLAPDDASVWGLLSDAEGWGDSLAEVRIADGEVLRRITMDEVIAANPDLDILGARRNDRRKSDPVSNERNSVGRWLTDPFHLNDVDPLPPALASAFPMFEAGDLVISARSLNMIFVIDPDTAEVKWWWAGTLRRQHDPDWIETGEIIVYDNRLGQDASRIVAVDPAESRQRTLFDGAGSGFFSRVRGKQQRRPDGSLIITSPQQGHAFEIDGEGSVVFEIVNAKPGSAAENYVISELRWYPLDRFDPASWDCAAAQ